MPRLGEKLQRRSFEDPKMNPQPLATWQVSVPPFTPAACAGAASATAPEISAALNAVNPNLFDIVSFSFMVSGVPPATLGLPAPCHMAAFAQKPEAPGQERAAPEGVPFGMGKVSFDRARGRADCRGFTAEECRH